ncbi:MAG: hypothetical protein JWM88_861 [Verrucomicrobia bacterium]|nr:hypothetical protein [Verrucomicrobiota bacterium]
MLSLRKKKTDGSGSSEARPWHPNLRNAARLPDTKVIRTSFFVNGVALFIVTGALLWFAFQEYKLHNLNRQIGDWQAQIDRDRKESDRFVALYQQFQAEDAKINEVKTFVNSRPAASALLMHIGETLPEEIALDTFDLQAGGLALRGTVRGSPDEAAGYATAYLDQLRADKVLAQNFSKVAFSGGGILRNAETGRLSLELFLKFGPNPKEKK